MSYEIVAAVAQYISTPVKNSENNNQSPRACEVSPSNNGTPHTRSQTKLAKKFVSPKRPLRPKENQIVTTPSPIKLSVKRRSHSPKKTPRRQLLQKQARAIMPKGYVPAFIISPTKMAANSIKARISRQGKTKRQLLRSPPKILSKPFTSMSLLNVNSENDTQDSIEYMSEDTLSGGEGDGMTNSAKLRQSRKRKRKTRVVKSDRMMDEEGDADIEGCDADSQEEGEDDDLMDELMRASSTIKFDLKKNASDEKTKKKTRKDTTFDLLAPDLIECDPLRDERDTAFAQAYLLRVKDTLKNEKEKYGEFLKIFYEFGKSGQNTPLQLYDDICNLLLPFPDLVSDFAGFLLPEQAFACGCLMTNLEFHRAREFLRKVEVNFTKRPSHFQQILKAFSQWQKLSKHSAQDLKDAVMPLLKGQQHLLDEFSLFFEDERPPESHMTEFEEITVDSDDEKNEQYFDGFEEIEIPDQDGDYSGTKWCRCGCHKNSDDVKWSERKRHCMSCGIKVIKGRLYLQSSEKVLKPIGVRYLGKKPAHLEEKDADSALVIPDDDEDSSEAVIPPKTRPNWWLKKKKLKIKMAAKRKFKGKKLLRESTEENSTKENQVEEKSSNIGSPVVSLSPLETIFEDAVLTPDSCSAGQDPADMPKDFSALRDEIKKDQDQLKERSEAVKSPIPSITSEPVVEKSLFGLGENTIRQDLMLSDSSTNKDNENLSSWNIKKQSSSESLSQSSNNSSSKSDSNSRISMDDSNNDKSGITDEPRIVLKINLNKNRSQRMKKFEDGTYEEASICDSSITDEGNELKQEDKEFSGDSDSATITGVCENDDIVPHIGSESQSSESNIGKSSHTESESMTPHTSEGESSCGSAQSWTREEDRLILQKCQSEGANDSTYQWVANQLSHRTSDQVSGRFHKLMKLFGELDTTTEGEETGAETDEDTLP